MFYLKKIIAVMGNNVYRNEMKILEENLRRQGMEICSFFMEKSGLAELTAEGVREMVWQSMGEEEKSCLWMTDVSELAKLLCREGQPVLALLHEGNRNQDFSEVGYACEEPENLDAQYMDRVFRRHQRLPWDIMETERCLIRETMVEDVDAFYEIYKEPSITRYTEGLFEEPEQERKYICDYIDCVYSFYHLGIWTIMKKDTGEIIGRAGLNYREGYEEPELGFVIGCPWQRQGFAEEVCRGILRYGREEFAFPVVQAFVHPENKASLALCRKLGMQPAGEAEISGERLLCMKISF